MTIINIQTKVKMDLNKIVKQKNSLLTDSPELFAIWSLKKNTEDIYSITKGSGKKIWWFCPVCLSEYQQVVYSKTAGCGCPICSGKIVNQHNSIENTAPEIVDYMLDKNNAKIFTKYSDKKIDWKCPYCDTIIKNKQIKRITQFGLKCPQCSDGTSYPERIMANILAFLKLEYIHDTSLCFSENKRYDFFLPEYNAIVEMHGLQHYSENGFETAGGDNLKTVKQNDDKKKYIAIKNNIAHYVVIDSRESKIEWIRNEIEKNDFFSQFDINSLDWEYIDFKSKNSKKVECLNMYLSGLYDFKNLANYFKVDYGTILTWIKSWSSIGKCIYIKNDQKRKIIQLDKKLNVIKEWDSISEARKIYKNVMKVLNKERSNSKGYIFIYEDEYENFINNNKIELYQNKKIEKKVVQLTKDGIFICEYDSITNASLAIGRKNPTGISGVCNGRKNTSGGYKWMFKEDYENMKKESF